MTRDQWKEFSPYITPDVIGEGMDYNFVKKLHLFRTTTDIPMIFHAGKEFSGHAAKGYHPMGRAVDLHFGGSKSLREIFSLLDAFGLFGGIGYYTWWNHPGFHLDDRPATSYQRWLSDRKNNYIYLIPGGF